MRYPFFFTAPFPERNFCFREGAGYSGIRPGLEWRGPGPLLARGGPRLGFVGNMGSWPDPVLISFDASKAFSGGLWRSDCWWGLRPSGRPATPVPDSPGGD